MTEQEQINELRRTVDDLKRKIQAMEMDRIEDSNLLLPSHEFPAQSPEPVYHPTGWTPDSEGSGVWKSTQRLPGAASSQDTGLASHYNWHNPNDGATYYASADDADLGLIRHPNNAGAIENYGKLKKILAIADPTHLRWSNATAGLYQLEARWTTVTVFDNDTAISDWTDTGLHLENCSGTRI